MSGPSVPWKYSEHRDGVTARAVVGSFMASVHDCDGDFSFWYVRENGVVIAEGESRSAAQPYHFDQCVMDAEDVLRARAALDGERLA
jgi:hypothetical protein